MNLTSFNPGELLNTLDTNLQIINRVSGEMPKTMNFGCGIDIKPEQLNVDVAFSEHVISANRDVWLMQGLWENQHEFPGGYFDSIICNDVLEHIHPDEIGNLLYCMNCSMAMEGILEIRVPDFAGMASRLHELTSMQRKWKKKHFDEFREIELFWMAPYKNGAQGHQSIWTFDVTTERLAKEGFLLYGYQIDGLTAHYIFTKQSSCQL